jgi:site-specific recombinase XerD
MAEQSLPQFGFRYDVKLLAYVNNLYAGHPRENIFGEYIVFLRTEGAVSDRTRNLYVKDLFGSYDPEKNFFRSAEYTFFTFLDRQKTASLKQIDRELVRKYIVWLHDNGIANSSINRRLSALRSFYKFLLITEKIKNSPLPVGTHAQKSPRSSLSVKMDRHIPNFLTVPEIQKLIEAPDVSKPAGIRDRAMLELLYASGLRVSELWQLNLDSLNLDTREVRVIGKGSKERIVLMGVPAANALNDYIVHGRSELAGQPRERALFLNKQGKRLTMRGIQKLLKHYTAACGIEKNVHPHVLRHTFATHMLDGGADLRVVQELLGHADLSSTQIYTHVTKQQARKVYLATHPMAQEKEGLYGNSE